MENGMETGWRLQVRIELMNLYRDNPAGLADLLTFFDNQARDNPVAANDLHVVIRNMLQRDMSQHVRAYTDQIIQEERRRRLNALPFAPGIAHDNINGQPQEVRIGFDLGTCWRAIFQFMRSNEGAALGIGTGLAQIWDTLAKETQAKLIENVAEMCGRRISDSYCSSIANSLSGTTAMYSVAICVVAVKCWINVTRWYSGQLTGKECAKYCVDTIVEYGAGFFGALGGMALGAMINPFVAAFMSVFGGFVCGSAAKELVALLTNKIFGLEVRAARVNAYEFFEVDEHATQEQIDRAYETRMIRNIDDQNQDRRRNVAMMANVNMTIIQRDRLENRQTRVVGPN